MKKTNNIIKLNGTSNYFPQIEATVEELLPMYYYGFVTPSTLKALVTDESVVDKLVSDYKSTRSNSKQAYQENLSRWMDKTDEVRVDLNAYLSGDLDRIDIMVKYGLDYKKLKSFFSDVLGVDSVKDWSKRKSISQKNTTLGLYGVEHTALLEDVQKKRVATTRERYGVDNVMELSEFKDKLKETMLSKYGVEHNFQLSDPAKNWRKSTYNTLTRDDKWKAVLSKYDESEIFLQELPLSRRDFVISTLSNDHVENLIKLWNDEYGLMEYPDNQLFKLSIDFSIPWLKYYNQKGLLKVPEVYLEKTVSKYETMLEHKLKELNIPYVRNHRKLLDGLEVDFYLPEHGLAIEVNPSSTHNSNIFAKTSNRSYLNRSKDRGYHYDKYRLCKDKGVILIQLFEYDLEPNRFTSIVWPRLEQQILGYSTRLYARKTTIEEISTKTARTFLENYHTQGYIASKVKYGMYHNGDLVAVATFGDNRGTVELKRLCFKPGIQVLGGLSKFIKRYFKDFDDDVITSYSDNNYGDGNGYASAGAEFVKETGPSLVFVSTSNPLDTYSWQIATPWSAKSGVIAKDNGGEYGGNVDEYVENHLTHKTDDKQGYDRIYTAGSKLWKFTR